MGKNEVTAINTSAKRKHFLKGKFVFYFKIEVKIYRGKKNYSRKLTVYVERMS